MRSVLNAENYDTELRVWDDKTVHLGLVRFPGILHDLGLSPHRSESLAIRIEVDTQPPQGAGTGRPLSETPHHASIALP